MSRYNKPKKGKYSAERTPFGNLLVGRRKGKSTIRVAKDLQSTSNLTKHTKKGTVFKESQQRALESQIRKSEK